MRRQSTAHSGTTHFPISYFVPRNYGKPDFVSLNEFHDAILSSDLKNVTNQLTADESLLESEYWLNVPKDDSYFGGTKQLRGGTPLFLALQQASLNPSAEAIEIVKLFLHKGANLDGFSDEWACLKLPALRNIPELWKEIQITASPKQLIVLLKELINSRDRTLTQQLLEGPLTLEVLKTHTTESIFDIAVVLGDLEMMKLLLSFKVHEAFPSAPFVALCKGNVFLHDKLSTMLVDFLLESGFDINSSELTLQRTGISEACRLERTFLASLFLQKGADPDVLDAHNNSALHFACTTPSLEIIQQILKKSNKSVNVVNKKGETPLQVWFDHASTSKGAEILLLRGADAQHACENGLLYSLMSKQWIAAVDLVTQYGARMSTVAPGGLTALNGFLAGYSPKIQYLHKIFSHGGFTEETVALVPKSETLQGKAQVILAYYMSWPQVRMLWIGHLKGESGSEKYFSALPKPILYDIIHYVTGHKLKLYK